MRCLYTAVNRIQSREARTNVPVRLREPNSTVYHSGPTSKDLWTKPKVRTRRRVLMQLRCPTSNLIG